MKKMILILALALSSIAFAGETKKVTIKTKDYLTTKDSYIQLLIGKKAQVDCNGPYMITKDHVSSYDVIESKWKLKVDYYTRKTLKGCPGDTTIERVIYGPAAKQTFARSDIEITVPVDVDVYVKVLEVVKLEKVKE